VEIDDVAAKVVKEEQKKATQTNPLMSILGR